METPIETQPTITLVAGAVLVALGIGVGFILGIMTVLVRVGAVVVSL